MAVIITGMDMPENCANCPLTYLDTGDDAYWGPNEYRCVKSNDPIDINDKERLDDCPLKSVDELIELIECEKSSFDKSDKAENALIYAYNTAIDIIKEYCEEE